MPLEIEKIKEELTELEFDDYPIEIVDDLKNWRWTENALDVLANYIYQKIKEAQNKKVEK
jgi:hypothetical protein